MKLADYLAEDRYTFDYTGKHNMLPKKLYNNIARCVKFLKTIDKKYDSIAFSGMSGAMIAPILGYRLKKQLILVRKEKDRCHSYQTVEGFKGCSKYIIVDDFICSGSTVERIQQEIFKSYPLATCIGTLQYTRDMSLSKKSLLKTNELLEKG